MSLQDALELASHNLYYNSSSDDPFGTRFRSMIMKAIEEQDKVPINDLPYDSQRRAMARVNEDYANGLSFSNIDLVSVLGDPNARVTLTNDAEELLAYLKKSSAERQERDKTLESTRESRIEERKKKYQEVGIALLVS